MQVRVGTIMRLLRLGLRLSRGISTRVTIGVVLRVTMTATMRVTVRVGENGIGDEHEHHQGQEQGRLHELRQEQEEEYRTQLKTSSPPPQSNQNSVFSLFLHMVCSVSLVTADRHSCPVGTISAHVEGKQ